MDLTELRTALTHHDADPTTVLHQIQTKKKRRRRRHGIIGSLAAATLIATGAGIWSATSPSPISPNSALNSSRASTTTSGNPNPAVAADGCLPLEGWLSRERGISAVTGVGTQTGRTKPDGYINHEVVITDIKTLAGPKIAEGTKAWVKVPDHTAKPGVVDAAPDGPLWGPGNTFFGVYIPQKLNRGPLGATLHQLPLVGDKVIFKSSGCWGSFSLGDLHGTPYQGPLTEVPGSDTYAHLAPQGFVAVPLTAVEQILRR